MRCLARFRLALLSTGVAQAASVQNASTSATPSTSWDDRSCAGRSSGDCRNP